MSADDSVERLAYSYGCPAGFDLGLEAREQLYLGNRLWNRLVEIWKAHEAAKAAIWVSVPAVAAAQQMLDAAEEAVEAAYEQIRRSRQADRSTVPRDADKETLGAAGQHRDAVRDLRDTARQAARKLLRDAFTAAKRERARAEKTTYAEFTALGLGWATWNAIARPVSGAFARAVKAVEQRRMQGEAADGPHFRRFDGTGTITVTVMSAAAVPPRTIPALNSGQHPRSGVMRLEPWADPDAGRPKGNARHGTLRLVIGRSREHGPLPLEIPVVLDRCLPADADVCEVKVTRYRQGARYRVKVSVACQQPRRVHAVSGRRVAVRLSWRAAQDGWVSVAHVASSVPLPPLPPLPASLAEVVRVGDDGRSAEIFAHPAWRRLRDRDAAIRSVRDQNTDVLRDKVCAELRGNPALEEEAGVTAAEVARWRAPRRFQKLAATWPGGHPLAGNRPAPAPAGEAAAVAVWKQAHPVPRRKGWRQVMLAELGLERPAPAGVLPEWRARDLHLLEYESHESAQVLGARRDAYRCAAKWLCDGAAGIVLDGTDLAAQKRVPAVDREDPEGARGARRLMHAAAPGELRAAIEAAAARRGVPVTGVK